VRPDLLHAIYTEKRLIFAQVVFLGLMIATQTIKATAILIIAMTCDPMSDVMETMSNTNFTRKRSPKVVASSKLVL